MAFPQFIAHTFAVQPAVARGFGTLVVGIGHYGSYACAVSIGVRPAHGANMPALIRSTSRDFA